MPLNTQRKTIFTECGTEFVDDIKFDKMTEEQIEQAKNAIKAYSRPLTKAEIIKLIARLQIICPEKTKNKLDTKAKTAIWIEELSKFPADVITYVLKMRYKWFPTLAEVLDTCNNEVAYRKLLERGIKCSDWH